VKHNKHILAAVLVAPVLAILSYFGIGYLFGEKPQPALEGQSYRLAEKPNCRWESGPSPGGTRTGCNWRSNPFFHWTAPCWP
jgi:hypothetical protein